MSTKPRTPRQVYTADTPEQHVLANLERWARTSAWAASVAALKARQHLDRGHATRGPR